MMTKFLIYEEDEPLYSVLIPNLTLYEAEDLLRQYAGSEIVEGAG